MDALFQRMISDLFGHFNIFYEPISTMGLESSGINFELKAISINYLDLSGRKRIQLCHSQHLGKLNVVSILEFVTFIKIDSDYTRISLSENSDIDGRSFFTIDIINNEIMAIVEEGKSLRTISL